jgi:addiction module RelE/StbE family toxin
MAFRIIWTRTAREDLKSIIQYIKSDNPKAAESFGFKLIKEAESVAEFPKSGRIVPEENNLLIREVICKPYRITYRLDEQNQTIVIARIWHAARGKPQF